MTFKYKDCRLGGVTRSMRLGGEVFVNRFLQHVVPKGFRRVRYYGFLANATGREALRKIHTAWLASMKAGLAVLTQYAQDLEQAESEGGELGDWTPTCQDCGGPLRYLPRRLDILRADDTS